MILMLLLFIIVIMVLAALSGIGSSFFILGGIFRWAEFRKIKKEYELTNTYTSVCKKLLGIKGNDLYIFSSSKEYEKINFNELQALVIKEEDYTLKSFPATSPLIPRTEATPGNLTLTICGKNDQNHEILFSRSNPNVKDRQSSIYKMNYKKTEDYYELLKKQMI